MIGKKKEKEVREQPKSSEKAARLKETKAIIEKKFGKGSLMCATEKPKFHESISTGSIGLDMALGIGGLPKGRIIEIYGPESSGKTTLSTHVIAEAHKADPETACAIIDAEHAFDITYAESIGVDVDRMYICQPDYGEQGLDIAESIIATGDFAVVVIDSVSALVPKAELEGNMGDSKPGLQARLMNQALRKLTAVASKTGTILIFINQLRDKIGVMYGSPETTTGGNGLKFYASVRLDIRRHLADPIKNGAKDSEIIGHPCTVKVRKNKVASPSKEAKFNIIFGVGIDKFQEAITLAVEENIIQRAGSWYSYNELKLGQGIESVVTILRDNEELYEDIKKQLMQTYQPVDINPAEEEEQEQIKEDDGI